MSYCRCDIDSDVYSYRTVTEDDRACWITYPSSAFYEDDSIQESYADYSLNEFRRTLMLLREKGLVVPDRTFERVDREIIENKEYTGILENWNVLIWDDLGLFMTGYVYEHKGFPTGSYIRTSFVQESLDKQFKAGDLVFTRNSSYLLR